MSVRILTGGAAREAVERVVPQLVADKVASGITGLDPDLWGEAAVEESSKRLGWTEAVATSRPLVAEITALREDLRAKGVDHIVLGGMGGSSLAPEVITRTAGVALTVLDSTDPGQVLSALQDRLERSALVVSSKSGSTVETDSQRRVYEKAFADAGIDPRERIIVVTDPGSPLDSSAREAGYRVFNADPNVGGRFSALTAFGLVPSGLAGADIAELLDEAESELVYLAVDQDDNPGLILGAALAGASPLKDKTGIVADGTHIVGFADWAEQLVAESTGKEGKGLLPVVLGLDAPELSDVPEDLQVVRLVDEATLSRNSEHLAAGEIVMSGTLGELILVWEYAIAVAGRLLGINPFDQPDVESAKIAARGLLDARPEPTPPAFTEGGIEVRGTDDVLSGVTDLRAAVQALLAQVGPTGYVAIQAYVNRLALPRLEETRNIVAAEVHRPVTFGWGPRFLHSTGQYHKGGPAVGVFLQITADAPEDLEIPDRPFTFGQLIQAQATGDATVLADHGRPVLRLNLTSDAATTALFDALNPRA
ncbi:glucose-6-phosphate isomerase [Naasia aerilata]|uniref:Glucose-6-phosphate isomerase n=1 Tax=Naasia aerilata TaxID=1162966 RepID=A0ABM8GG25_9MICO|nr:glucose-6-phosphate isomerase [Naasia aerilata]BDZ47039.1 glucose-6-phosphate isomerase [Naasia aerilata]